MKRFFELTLIVLLMYPLSIGFGQETGSTQITPVDVGKISEGDHSSYIHYLKEAGKAPVDYLIEKYKTCDIIILGESHQVRENCELIASMMLPLYEQAGLRIVGSEFIKSKYNDEVDEIVCAENYDEQKVIEIFRGNAWPTWGFQEYMDIVRAVWHVNSNLPEGAEKLLLIGMDDDWSQYDAWFDPNQDQMEKFKRRLKREKNLVDSFLNVYNENSGKALVHIGFDHTFRQVPPKFGAELHGKFGDKVFQIGLHMKYPSRKNSGTLIPFIEKIMAAHGNRPAGFDIENSPFAELRDEKVVYFQHPAFINFADLTRGYIFIKPVAELRKVTWMPNFINEENFEKAKAIALKARWVKKGECKNPEQLNESLAKYFSGN